MKQRLRFSIRGVVQGIGFRPFVYRVALEETLTGFVRNDADGVTVEVEGEKDRLARFAARLASELPTGGRIEDLSSETLSIRADETAFTICESLSADHTLPTLSPDRYVCADCLREMRDPGDRRYRYPFINCTHCGPRYTIVHALPYDRQRTAMRSFPLCPACAAEYRNPADRRFHAEPVACPLCGPAVRLVSPANGLESGDPVAAAARYLCEGRVVAVKGIGGFHLAVNAADCEAVERLRELKRRPRKPFALMVRDLDVAKRIAAVDDESAALLSAPVAPIVLLPAATGLPMMEWIAPGLRDIGLMLPYSPLHHLLFDDGPEVLVMTSGNAPSEPISTENEDALSRLGADATLLHNRDIVVAADDSVIRVAPRGSVMIRRARGYVPAVLDGRFLPDCSVLGLGALLKVTVTALHGGRIIVGRHLGDLDNERAEDAFFDEVERTLDFLRFTPTRIALDLHPDLASADLATERFGGLPIVRVQHHHAHLAAVLAEHGVPPDECVVGIVLDGFGLGTDGALWGGEVLCGGYTDFERVAHLRYIPQPGGDRAAAEPLRMALSLLADAGLPLDAVPGTDPRLLEILGIVSVSPFTSSAGRLFDGAAALIGIAPRVQDYEGEAAACLEATADPSVEDAYPLPLESGVFDTRAVTSAIVSDPASAPVRAARFINGLADGLVRAALQTGMPRAVLGGGCMVNRLLTDRLMRGLSREGVSVLFPGRLPPGDGAISVGQVAVAACRTGATL